MEFFPEFILRRNRFRGTPHWSIALATGIPIAVLLLVHGEISILGDMYAFGLLGAFTVTCIGLDIIRYRERRVHDAILDRPDHYSSNGHTSVKNGGFFHPFIINQLPPLSFAHGNGQEAPAPPLRR